MAAKHTPITIIINRVRWTDLEPADQARITKARKALAAHVGKKIHDKVNGNEQTTGNPM